LGDSLHLLVRILFIFLHPISIDTATIIRIPPNKKLLMTADQKKMGAQSRVIGPQIP
jgi:hypothetical protein